MKEIICVFFIFSFLGCNPQKTKKIERSNNSDSIYTKFIGREIRTFLDDVKFKNYKKVLIADSKPGVATSLWVHYDNDVDIELYPDKFEHMTPFDPNFRWDINLFKLENIRTIIIYKKDKVVRIFGDSIPNGYVRSNGYK